MQQKLQPSVRHQFGGIFRPPSARDQEQAFQRPSLHDRKLVVLSVQVFGQTRAGSSSQHFVQARTAQVGIDQQHPPSVLPHQYLRQVRRGERLPFLGQSAGDQHLLERHSFARMIKARTQGTELLRAPRPIIAVEKQHGRRIRPPLRRSAPSQQGVQIERTGERRNPCPR